MARFSISQAFKEGLSGYFKHLPLLLLGGALASSYYLLSPQADKLYKQTRSAIVAEVKGENASLTFSQKAEKFKEDFFTPKETGSSSHPLMAFVWGLVFLYFSFALTCLSLELFKKGSSSGLFFIVDIKKLLRLLGASLVFGLCVGLLSFGIIITSYAFTTLAGLPSYINFIAYTIIALISIRYMLISYCVADGVQGVTTLLSCSNSLVSKCAIKFTLFFIANMILILFLQICFGFVFSPLEAIVSLSGIADFCAGTVTIPLGIMTTTSVYLQLKKISTSDV